MLTTLFSRQRSKAQTRPARHEIEIEKYFGAPGRSLIAGVDHTAIRDVTKVFLCFSNRSGSNYLAELLASTGQFNIAGEIYNHSVIARQCDAHGLNSFDDYIVHQITKHQITNRFISKISLSQLLLLEKFGLLDTIFADARYILIERGDKLGQAISHEIANQTKQWTANHTAEIDKDSVVFDAGAISRKIDNLIENYASFDAFFARRHIVPALVSYENLTVAPCNTVHAALLTFGMNISEFKPRQVRTRQQRDSLNSAFKHRYLEAMRPVP